MKEYWVNVYEWGCSTLYPNKDNCINWNKAAYEKKLVLYRIHVKMKEPKPKYDIMDGYKKIANDRHWMDN